MKATRAYIEGLTTALAQNTSLSFREGENWAADTKKKELIYNPTTLTQYDSEIVKGLIIHETGHILETIPQKTELQEKYPLMQFVYNALEDMRIEYKQMQRYGAWGVQGLAILNATFISELIEHTTDAPDPMNIITTALQNLIIRNIANNDQGQTVRIPYSDHKNKLSREAIKLSQDIDDKNITEIASRALCTQEIQTLADTQIFPLIKHLLDKIPKEQQQEKMQSEADNQKVTPEKNGKPTPLKARLPVIETDQELDGLLRPYARTLSSRLTTILHELRAKRFTGLHKTGKLLSKNAYKVLTDDTRIFSKKTNPNVPDYNIILCLDESGSMRYERHHYAYIAAHLLTMVCKQLNFPIAYVKYGDRAIVISELSSYRPFNDNQENDDRGALKEAKKLLDPQRQNIVFMLSDGAIVTEVVDVVRDIKKTGALIIGVGVGITGNELQQNYGDAINVPDVTQLPMALVSLLKRIIHR